MTQLVYICSENAIALESNLHNYDVFLPEIEYDDFINEYDGEGDAEHAWVQFLETGQAAPDIDSSAFELITLNQAIELRLEGCEDHTRVTDEAFKIENADPEYLEVRRAVKDSMVKLGWSCVRDRNLSAYFVKDHIKVRLSDHALGVDWTGREQTGGADYDVVYNGQTSGEIINEFLQFLCEPT